ncbi:hypothetical protein DTL42_06005 [Bremerella cremea]|uniref:Uncharacterized protein n=1 Tax=Bremerella cremea TaxID=1031537 RepID=A0A368KW77_9BACT|nr:hypothetical protein [Bremerella cremea]RCS54680.1 hypothetical protein DTL42_06005 [Bremerella cremea]
MTVRKTLLLLLACTIGPAFFSSASKAGEIPSRDSLVSVRMNADFRPELEFRIAEALQRPPLEWSIAQDHRFAEIAQPVENVDIADEMVARWDILFANNPTHTPEKREILGSQIQALRKAGRQLQVVSDEFVAAWFQSAAYFAAQAHPADEISFDDLPQVHTGEEIAMELKAEQAQFPLDPYGYEEYNGYFEPEVYDWFVFVTDDLTVVYVHENSDIMPLEVAPQVVASETRDEQEVPESVKRAIRESVRSVFSGEIDVFGLAKQAQETSRSVTLPIWNRYVKENHLLRIEQVAQLKEIFRF